MSSTESLLPPVSLPDAAKAIGVELEAFRRKDRRNRFKLTDAPRPEWCTDKRMKFFSPVSVERAKEDHAATRELRRTNKALATKYLDKGVVAATRTDRGAKRLVIAGALLQSKDQPEGCQRMGIQVQPGENYPSAVLRAVRAMPEASRAKLKELVDWVEEYVASEGAGA
jgi:hypothetical protein